MAKVLDNRDYQDNELDAIYPKLDTTVVSSIKSIVSQSNVQQQQSPPLLSSQQTQSCVLQQTTVSVHRNGHSRNPSSINGITIATQVIQPPPNKPDAINNLLKLIRFRSSYDECDEKSKNRTKCGIREARLFMMFILIVVFLISGTVFFVMWFTELYNDSIISSLILAKNSTALHYFINPPLNPLLRVHIFNYTNTERFINGLDDKMIVEDVGPFVYTEKAQKVEVNYNDNNTISYREFRSFEFQPSLSTAQQQDRVIVPNIPLLTTSWELSKSGWKEAIFSTATLFESFEAFVNLPAHSFLWGYTDNLYEKLKTLSVFGKTLKPTFGILMTRNGTSEETFTVNTGVDDIHKLNVIDNFNGKPHMDFWSTNECNRVDGTDGSQFPPHLLDKKHTLEVFIKAFCRKFPMIYDSEVSLFNGVPAYRYKAPQNVFDSAKENPSNGCYCDVSSGKCAPRGVFNATLCFDAPIYSSFPHFLNGDPKLFKNIKGLSPDEEKHLTYADVHPRLAFPMAGSSRFQINIQVFKSRNELSRFEEGQILPIMWMEITSDNVPEELQSIIYHSTLSVNAIQLSLRYGSLFGLAVSITLLVAGCYLKSSNSDQIARTKGIKNIKQAAGTVTIEELVTIDLNDPSLTHTESSKKETNLGIL